MKLLAAVQDHTKACAKSSGGGGDVCGDLNEQKVRFDEFRRIRRILHPQHPQRELRVEDAEGRQGWG